MKFSRARVLVFLTLSSSIAFAQAENSLATAYQFSADGLQAFDENRYEEALRKFSSAYAVVKLPTLALFMARAQVKLGHYTEASQLYTEALALDDGPGSHDVQEKARHEAGEEREALTIRAPKLQVQVQGAPVQDVTFQVDGKLVPTSALLEGRMVNPGVHTIDASCGNQSLKKVEAFSDESRRTLVFAFTAPPARVTVPHNPPDQQPPRPHEESSAIRRAAWVSLGVGGAALAFSGTTAIWAWTKHRELDQAGKWDVNLCPPGGAGGDCREYRTLRTLSTIGFYTGLAGAATGVVLFLTSSPGAETQSKQHISAYLSPTSAGLTCTF